MLQWIVLFIYNLIITRLIIGIEYLKHVFNILISMAFKRQIKNNMNNILHLVYVLNITKYCITTYTLLFSVS